MVGKTINMCDKYLVLDEFCQLDRYILAAKEYSKYLTRNHGERAILS